MAEAEKQTMEEALRYFAARIPEEAPNTFSGQMCPQLVSCDEKAKTLIFSYETADWMRNPGGAVHGGVIAEEGTPQQIFEDPQNERTKDFLSKVIHVI